MGIVSVRFNAEEEKVLNRLVDHYGENRSKLMKRSLIEMYEDLADRNEIEKFEARANKGNVRFYGVKDVLAAYDKKKKAASGRKIKER